MHFESTLKNAISLRVYTIANEHIKQSKENCAIIPSETLSAKNKN